MFLIEWLFFLTATTGSFHSSTCDYKSIIAQNTREVKIQHRDLTELVSILGYYKGMIETDENEIDTGNIDRMLEKIHHELEKHTK